MDSPVTTAPPGAPSLEQIKAGMRSNWMAGDFGIVARTISAGAEAFIERLAIPAGSRVLDVATGTGNLALPLARSGCFVTGVDIAPNLLVQARERAASEGLAIAFDEGDAEAMPYPDASFDAVVTMFGAMFAPRPAVVAAELARVLKPGGRLAMANWNPIGFTGQMFKLGSKYAPPPSTVPPSVLWGDETTARQRLATGFKEIQTEVIAIDFNLPFDAAGTVNFFRTYFGPTKTAFDRMDEATAKAYTADLIALWSSANVAQDPTQQTLIRNQYLQVTATRV